MESLHVLLEVGISLHVVLLKNEANELDLFLKKESSTYVFTKSLFVEVAGAFHFAVIVGALSILIKLKWSLT